MPDVNWPMFWALIAAFAVRGVYRFISAAISQLISN